MLISPFLKKSSKFGALLLATLKPNSNSLLYPKKMRFIQLLRRSQPRLLRTFTPSVLKWNPSVSTHTFQGRRLVSNNTTISGPRCSDMTSADLLKELSKKNDQDGIIVGFSYPLEESAIGKREEGNIVVRSK